MIVKEITICWKLERECGHMEYIACIEGHEFLTNDLYYGDTIWLTIAGMLDTVSKMFKMFEEIKDTDIIKIKETELGSSLMERLIEDHKTIWGTKNPDRILNG